MIHVAVAVVANAAGDILISKRHDHLHQGGLWEYPGGKLEPGESVEQALARELDEELGIRVHAARPLIRIPHDYADRRVLLDVWRVSDWSGEPAGREGQAIRWAAVEELAQVDFPAANRPITTALRLPSLYAISPEPTDQAAFLDALEALLERDVTLLQLRAKNLRGSALRELAEQVAARCRARGTAMMINRDIELARRLGCGLQLNAGQLQELTARPLPATQWVAASCHNAAELARAAELNVDFVVLSPVQRTASHPDATPLGWARFQCLTEQAVMPVFALGGVGKADRQRAWQHGAQGVAGIGAFWP